MTATDADELVYRMFQDPDLPALLDLWERDGGWGRLTQSQWRSWYRDTPYEHALVCVAVDSTGALAGQLMGLPCRLLVAGVKVKALRLSAPILRSDVRLVSTNEQHPAGQLTEAIVAEAQRRGFAVVYAVPERRVIVWVRRALPRFATREFGCRSLQLVDFAGHDRPGGMAAELSRWDDSAFESLWAEAARNLPFTCAVVRSARGIRYRNRGHIMIDVRSEGNDTLAGYCAFRRGDGLLVDLLARDHESIEPVLTAALRFLASRTSEALERVTAMEAPLLAPTLKAIGFEPVNFRFGFMVRGLADSVNTEQLAPDGWWLTGGD